MINPILASSARRRMRSWRTPVLITLYAMVLAAFMIFYAFRYFIRPTIGIATMSLGVDGYVLLLVLQAALLVLVGPAMTAGSIAGERERQTLDLLRVTNTGSFRIVLGKLLESFGFLCLLVISSLPILSLILVTGGANIGQVFTSVLFLLLMALAVLSAGVLASAVCKRVATATVVAYLIVFGLGVLTLIPLWWDAKQIGAIYDAARNANTQLKAIDYMPIAFVANPGFALLSLLYDQTQMEIANRVIGQFSHTFNVTFQWLPFAKCYIYHMVVLAGFSVVSLGLATWFVRPNRRGKRIRKGKRL